MDVLSAGEIDEIVDDSYMVKKYNEVVDRESAYEILTGKLEDAHTAEAQEELAKQQESAAKTTTRGRGRAHQKRGGIMMVMNVSNQFNFFCLEDLHGFAIVDTGCDQKYGGA